MRIDYLWRSIPLFATLFLIPQLFNGEGSVSATTGMDSTVILQFLEPLIMLWVFEAYSLNRKKRLTESDYKSMLLSVTLAAIVFVTFILWWIDDATPGDVNQSIILSALYIVFLTAAGLWRVIKNGYSIFWYLGYVVLLPMAVTMFIAIIQLLSVRESDLNIVILYLMLRSLASFIPQGYQKRPSKHSKKDKRKAKRKIHYRRKRRSRFRGWKS